MESVDILKLLLTTPGRFWDENQPILSILIRYYQTADVMNMCTGEKVTDHKPAGALSAEMLSCLRG